MPNFFSSKQGDVSRLIVIRHGRTKKNTEGRIGIIDDTPLDELGVKQAKLAGERLKNFPVAALYTSPVVRAAQTAQIISEAIGIPPEVHEALREMDLGNISGRTFAEVREELPEDFKKITGWIKGQPDEAIIRPVYSGMEPIEELEARVNTFVKMILENYARKTVCVVTHLAFIKGLMATLFGRTVHKPMNFLAFNTSLTIVDFENSVPVLMRFNDCGHLDMDDVYGKVTAL